ncbi:MAG: HAD-IA family hydrolase [Proteobacteria bacterium]|nr:HAD-IA family hydrolase [Pseudomonadota bacterium]
MDPTVQLLAKLTDRGVPCYGLSNISGKNYEFLIGKHAFFSLLNGVVVSAHENLLKPEPAIYQLICERYQLKASETLFVDDMDTNCRAATEAGLNSIKFEGIASCVQIDELLATG